MAWRTVTTIVVANNASTSALESIPVMSSCEKTHVFGAATLPSERALPGAERTLLDCRLECFWGALGACCRHRFDEANVVRIQRCGFCLWSIESSEHEKQCDDDDCHLSLFFAFRREREKERDAGITLALSLSVF